MFQSAVPATQASTHSLDRLWMRFGMGLLLILAVMAITLFQNHAWMLNSRAASQAVSLLDRQAMLGQRIAFLSNQTLPVPSASATELAESVALFDAARTDLAALSPPQAAGGADAADQAARAEADFLQTALALLAARDPSDRAALARTLQVQERAMRPRIATLSRLHGEDHAAAIDSQIRIQNRLWLTVLLVSVAQMMLVMLPAQIAINGTLHDLRRRIHRLRERQTALRRANAELMNRSLEDSASGLPSRHAAIPLIEAALSRGDDPPSLIMFNLSDHGGRDHADAAALLSMIAILQDEREEDDVLMRVGGDDVVLMTRDDPGRVARHMARALATAANLMPDSSACRCAIGIATAEAGSTAPDLLRCAARATAMARSRGGGSIVTYGPDMQRADCDLARLAQDLADALAVGAVGAAFAPQVDLTDGRVTGLIATPAWHHPQWGPISRDRIAAVAEREGMQLKLDRAVWSAALQDVVRWIDAGLDVPPVSLGASPDTIADPRLLSGLMTHLTSIGVAPAAIRITASVATWSDAASPLARMNVERLCAVGLAVVPHDCGSGALDLSGIVTLDTAEVMLDPALVGQLVDAQHVDGLRAIVQMLTACGMAVGARDVPDAATLAAIRQAGCTTAHGPALGPTLSGEQMLHHLRQVAIAPVAGGGRLLRA